MEGGKDAAGKTAPANGQTGVIQSAYRRKPSGAAELSEIERAQPEEAGRRDDGEALPAEARLAEPGGGWDEGASFRGFVSVWDLVDGREPVLYTAWFYLVDSGTIFRAGTTEVVAEVIQRGLECEDEALAGQILEAVRRCRTQDPAAARDITPAPAPGP